MGTRASHAKPLGGCLMVEYFCKMGIASVEFYRKFPDKEKPSCSGYLFLSSYTKEEICTIIIKWYAGEEVDLLT